MGWKYVMLENKLKRYPIIFPSDLVHIEVFTVCKLLVPTIDRVRVTGPSAGMIERLYVEGVGDKSETMNVASRGKFDETIINGYNYFHGIK